MATRFSGGAARRTILNNEDNATNYTTILWYTVRPLRAKDKRLTSRSTVIEQLNLFHFYHWLEAILEQQGEIPHLEVVAQPWVWGVLLHAPTDVCIYERVRG